MAEPLIVSPRFTPPTLGSNLPSRLTGRPAAPREPLIVPGQPRAVEHRPGNAMGRIPTRVATPPASDGPPLDSDAMQRDVESSTAYQALKSAGYIKENPLRREPHRALPEADASSSSNRQTEMPLQRIELESHQEFRMEIQQELRIEIRQQSVETTPRRSDPIALDLNGNGLQTTGIANGVQFDIDADGRLDQSSFISGGDAFLALDTNTNGRIDDGRELFGDQHGDANGYLALARYDDNNDGVIDRDDMVFQQLRLFTQGSDGSQQLRTLEEEGIASLALHYRHSNIALNQYDSVAQLSSFERLDGRQGLSGDLLLGYTHIG